MTAGRKIWMCGALALAAMAAKARRTGTAADKALCRRLAEGLLPAASVSDVPGMVVRGVGEFYLADVAWWGQD